MHLVDRIVDPPSLMSMVVVPLVEPAPVNEALTPSSPDDKVIAYGILKVTLAVPVVSAVSSSLQATSKATGIFSELCAVHDGSVPSDAKTVPADPIAYRDLFPAALPLIMSPRVVITLVAKPLVELNAPIKPQLPNSVRSPFITFT